MTVRRYADGLLSLGIEDFAPGLFLAGVADAFLRDELIPEMTKRGAISTFVDLDPAGDSYAQIVDAVASGSRTIVAAVEVHAKTSGKEILIALGKAPAAFRTVSGRAAMFGLKSARDRLNVGARVLLISCAGPDREALSPLVDGPAAPFLGATVVPQRR